MSDCIEVHAIVGNPLKSVQAKAWSASLKSRMVAAAEAGAMLPACRALLLGEFMQQEQPSLPGVARLLSSEASRLAELSQQNRAIHGVLHCTGLEEHRRKCDMTVLAKMFDSYRVEAVRYMGSDTCCNFEALRYSIQSDFAFLFSQIREQGVLTAEACGALTAVDDSLACVLLSVSQQIVHSIPSVLNALRDVTRMGIVDLN